MPPTQGLLGVGMSLGIARKDQGKKKPGGNLLFSQLIEDWEDPCGLGYIHTGAIRAGCEDHLKASPKPHTDTSTQGRRLPGSRS